MLISLNDIKKHYLTPESGEKRKVLTGVSLEMQESASCAVVGPSGSGKSTLLHIMGLLDSPDDGTMVFQGKNPASLKERERAAIRNREIGFVFQLHYLLPQYTVLENVLLPTLPASPRTAAECRMRARALLKRVGLERHLLSRPGELSGGERQRAAVVRALINSPSLVLADEPTGSLDRANALEVASLLLSLNREEGSALIVVTHSDEIASAMATVFRLADGRLIQT